VLVEEEMERFKEREGTITSGRERIAELEGYAKMLNLLLVILIFNHCQTNLEKLLNKNMIESGLQ